MSAPLGLIAGGGDLPVRVAAEACENGRDVYVLRLKGFEEPALADYPGQSVGMGEVGKQIKLLKAAGCEELVFAGIVSRPDFSALKLDWRGAKLLPGVLAAARQGDDALLRKLMGVFESEGFTVRGADDVASGLVAPRGLIAGPQPDANALSDMARGMVVARALGGLDIGQGCVVCDGLVLAVEAQEGTDRMLARVAQLDPALRGSEHGRRGVLVKTPKPVQDRKIDLPTIGVRTLEGAAQGGLAGIGVAAGGALLLDRSAITATATRLGVFVWGLDEPE